MPTVFDVHCQVIGPEVVQGFVERITRSGFNTTSKLSILGVIAAQGFYGQAWDAAKKAGLVAINLANFFGKEAFDLGDSNYLRLCKGAAYNFRLVTSGGRTLHIPQRDMWDRVVIEQIENLDTLAEKSKIPKRQWRTRRNNLQQYLLGDG
jgi:hypothetical protein